MKKLSNELLICAYIKAIEIELDNEFKLLLREEILKRKLKTQHLVISSIKQQKELG